MRVAEGAGEDAHVGEIELAARRGWIGCELLGEGVQMIDCQQETRHLASLGAAPIPRSQFLQHLRQAIDAPQINFWHPLDLFPLA